MKKLGSKLTYANVVATLALVLAIGGGTVYAAGKLKKNSVKSVNIAKGAVKNSDLGKNAVTGGKVKNGSLSGADLAPGTITADRFAAAVLSAISPDVTGTATIAGGTAVNGAADVTVPVGGTATFTPQDGQVSAVAAEAAMDLAKLPAATGCSPAVQVLVSDPTGLLDVVHMQPSTDSNTISRRTDRDADGPYGLLSPGTPITLTARVRGDVSCTATSKLDSVTIRIVQFK